MITHCFLKMRYWLEKCYDSSSCKNNLSVVRSVARDSRWPEHIKSQCIRHFALNLMYSKAVRWLPWKITWTEVQHGFLLRSSLMVPFSSKNKRTYYCVALLMSQYLGELFFSFFLQRWRFKVVVSFLDIGNALSSIFICDMNNRGRRRRLRGASEFDFEKTIFFSYRKEVSLFADWRLFYILRLTVIKNPVNVCKSDILITNR